MQCHFAGKRINVTYTNEEKLRFSRYVVESVKINGEGYQFKKDDPQMVKIERAIFDQKVNLIDIQVSLKAK